MKAKTLKYYCLVICIYISVFYPLLENINSKFSYWDDFFVVLFIGYIFSHKIKITKNISRIAICLSIVLLLGIGGTVIYHFQPISAVFEDIIANTKFFCALGLSYFFFSGNEIKKYSKKLSKHANVIILILFGLFLINQIANIYPRASDSEVSWIKGEMLFYEHPTYFAASVGFIICFILLLQEERKTKIIQLVLLCILGVTTGRIKMIAWLGIALLIWVFIIKRYKKIKFRYTIPLVAIGLAIGKNKIIKYFITYKKAARGLVYLTSFEVMKDFFPLGAGFATFGSGASSKYYSPLYSMYGMSNVYGFAKGDRKFINDTFWPIIAAQFGFFGVLVYAIMLYYIFKSIQNIYKKDAIYYYSALIAFIYLIISSVSESTFINCLSIPFALLIGYSIKSLKNIS